MSYGNLILPKVRPTILIFDKNRDTLETSKKEDEKNQLRKEQEPIKGVYVRD